MIRESFKLPLRSPSKAKLLIRRLLDSIISEPIKSVGLLASRLLLTSRKINSWGESTVRSLFVHRIEGPSSRKYNALVNGTHDDMGFLYEQQNAIDQSILEVHNYHDIRRDAISGLLHLANDRLVRLIGESTRTSSGYVTFEDNFDTSSKIDSSFPLQSPPAEVDPSAGSLHLGGQGDRLTQDEISSATLSAKFDGSSLTLSAFESDNSISDGKLYGDPRDAGENGVRVGKIILQKVRTVVDTQNPIETPAPAPGPLPGGSPTHPREVTTRTGRLKNLGPDPFN